MLNLKESNHTLVEVLQSSAKKNPHKHAYLFLENGVSENFITFQLLDKKARMVAEFLQRHKMQGKRILILYPAGLDFIITFMGCLYAGSVAVPLQCPSLSNLTDSTELLQFIDDNAELSGVFALQSMHAPLSNVFKNTKLFFQDTALMEIEKSKLFNLMTVSPKSIAYLQYTSGSTDRPKAAVILHQNLMASLKATSVAWLYTEASISLTWAPHAHVYGLVCGLLVPLLTDSLSIIMPTDVFIKNPLAWLKTNSTYKVTHSGCPNFGYELCVNAIQSNQLDDIDLSEWRVAVNGGDLVQVDTLEKFTEKFKVCGFHYKAFSPAYGMSEIAGAISVTHNHHHARRLNLDLEKMKQGQVVQAESTKQLRQVISNGQLLPHLSAVIVNSESQEQQSENQIGEIWLKGDSVAAGYWRNAEATERTFKAAIKGSQQAYFRTGDLGFIQNGELFITGRLKELIVVNGKKYYPPDLENAVLPVLNAFSVSAPHVAFSIIHRDKEQVIFLQEMNTDFDHSLYQELTHSIRRAIKLKIGIDLERVMLVEQDALARTASGKMQRNKSKFLYETNSLSIIYDERQTTKPTVMLDKQTEFSKKMVAIIATVLNLEVEQIRLDASISEYRFDSIAIIRLADAINNYFKLDLTPVFFYEFKTLADCIRKLENSYLDQKNPTKIKLNSTTVDSTDIAIIGMQGLFPQADNVDEFWENLINQKNCITEIPKERWDWNDYAGDPFVDDNKTNIKFGAFIKSVKAFDAAFFNISAREAELMDPQQRLFLQTAYKTIEDAGYSLKSLSDITTGLFVGMFNHDYAELIHQAGISDAYTTTGTAASILANRVSYLLNLTGPSEAIDTACSSSLVAIHHAVRAIQAGDCQMAIAGGVNLLLTPTAFISASKAAMLSVDGQCKTFDKEANGFVRGEGVAAILLKALDQAIADKDNIYGVIKGSAVNHGGHVSSLTVPNPNAQAQVIAKACERANLSLDSLQYIETHGTGTALGDPIEIKGLKQAFSDIHEKKFCGLGALKTTIGHLESAAGIASVFKVLLALKHEKIPANRNLVNLNPYIDLTDSPFFLMTQETAWASNQDRKRRAGISSFGFGGTNAHIIIEEYLPVLNAPTQQSITTYPISFSAKTQQALNDKIQEFHQWCKRQINASIVDISYTQNVGREHFNYRELFYAESLFEFKSSLSSYIANDFKHKFKFKSEKLSSQVATLSQQYLNGLIVDWQVIYSEPVIKKSLPTYPFAKTPYWLPLAKASNNFLFKLVLKSPDHWVYELDLLQYNDFINQHVINDAYIVPAAILIEVINQLAVLVNIENVIITANFYEAVRVESAVKTIQISLDHSNQVTVFKIKSADTLHAQGQLISSNVVTQPKKLSITTLRQRCQLTMTPLKFYQLFRGKKIGYGDYFQTISSIHYNANEVIARIQSTNDQHFSLSPALLDGAFQALFALVYELNFLVLPVSIEKLVPIKKLPKTCFVYAKKINLARLQFQLMVLDEDGNVLISIDQVTLKNYSVINHNELHYFKPVWVDTPLAIQAKKNQQKMLFIGNDANDLNIFQSAMNLSYSSIVISNDLSMFGEAFAKQLTAEFPETIVIRWKNSSDIASLNNGHFFNSLFDLMKVLVSHKSQNELTILVCGNTLTLDVMAVIGFFKSISQEYPTIQGRLVDSHNQTLNLYELYDTDVYVRYTHQQTRQIKIFEPSQLQDTAKKSLLRNNATYLISGGMGSLGLVIAEYLVNTYNANLILVGRSNLSEKYQHQLFLLSKPTNKVVYYQVDLSDTAISSQQWNAIKLQFPTINGVIHSAGVIQDAFLIHKSLADAQSVLKAKIDTVIQLDTLCQKEPLDFFLLCSSMASIVGNIGQTDYAYANAYLDEYAHHRQAHVNLKQRSGKTISVNWPLWKVSADKMSEQSQKDVLERTGLKSLTNQQGLQALEYALRADFTESQLIVTTGDMTKITASLANSTKLSVATPIKVPLESVNSQFLMQKTEIFLKELLASATRFSTHEIKANEPLETYGIDSVMIIGLNQKHLVSCQKPCFLNTQHWPNS
jgi:polyketide synthase PksL